MATTRKTNTTGVDSMMAVLKFVAAASFFLLWQVDAFGLTVNNGIAACGVGSNFKGGFCFGYSSRTTPTALFATLPEGYQEFGETAIREAARQCGLVFDDDDEGSGKNRLDIQWKAGSIIVTVHGEVSIAAANSSSSSSDTSDDDFDEENEDEDTNALFGDAMGEYDDDDDEQPIEQEEFSLSLLARTINNMLDDDGTGLAIAEVHSIEVTTPGVSDELVPGTPQFDAFKGFEVIVQQLDIKKQKVKTVVGRLVERNDEFTIVNIKGRMKKIKNDTVQSIRLPKAKKEKGTR